MQLLKNGQEIEITAGEFADILECRLAGIRKGGATPSDWMDLMGMLLSGFPAIIQALRLSDAMTNDAGVA